jgi:hypothetical protein
MLPNKNDSIRQGQTAKKSASCRIFYLPASFQGSCSCEAEGFCMVHKAGKGRKSCFCFRNGTGAVEKEAVK